MEFIFKLLLVFFFVQYCSCVTLNDIADSLQNMQRMLRKENECKVNCGEIESIKSHLREYIDLQISEYFNNKLNTDDGLLTKADMLFGLEDGFFDDRVRKNADTERVIHAFVSEKKIRKEIERKIDFVQRSVLENGVMIKSLRDDILRLERHNKELRKANYNMKEEVDKLKTSIVDHTKISEMISEDNGICLSSLERVNTSVRLQLNKLKTELDDTVEQRHNKRKIVFSAKIKYGQSYKDIKPWQTIIFGQVDLNVGLAYSGKTGEFTAPVDGVYVFHVHITGSDNRGLEIRMSKNAQTILLLYVRGSGHGTDGGDVAIQLEKGDVVRVEKYGPWGGKPFYIHHVFSFFTGFLLHETSEM